MSRAGQLNSNIPWSDLHRRMQETFRKWGIVDYLLPNFRESTHSVTVKFVQSGEWRDVTCSRFGSPNRNYHAVTLAFEAVRKADQRGIAGIFADVANQFALPAPPTGPYAVLGVRPGDSPERIRNAYMERVKSTHPDRGGDTKEFQQVRAAGRELGVVG